MTANDISLAPREFIDVRTAPQQQHWMTNRPRVKPAATMRTRQQGLISPAESVAEPAPKRAVEDQCNSSKRIAHTADTCTAEVVPLADQCKDCTMLFAHLTDLNDRYHALKHDHSQLMLHAQAQDAKLKLCELQNRQLLQLNECRNRPEAQPLESSVLSRMQQQLDMANRTINMLTDQLCLKSMMVDMALRNPHSFNKPPTQ